MHKHFSTSCCEWCISYCVSSLLIAWKLWWIIQHPFKCCEIFILYSKKMGVLNNWLLSRHPSLRWQWKVMPKLPRAFLILSTSCSVKLPWFKQRTNMDSITWIWSRLRFLNWLMKHMSLCICMFWQSFCTIQIFLYDQTIGI
jgi:hypothetical protein